MVEFNIWTCIEENQKMLIVSNLRWIDYILWPERGKITLRNNKVCESLPGFSRPCNAFHSLLWKYTWYGTSCVPGVRPSSQFSKSDSLPFLCGYHKMVCTHKERPPGLIPSTPSDQPELSERRVRARTLVRGIERIDDTVVMFKTLSNLHTGAAETDPGESRTFRRTLTDWLFPVSPIWSLPGLRPRRWSCPQPRGTEHPGRGFCTPR